MKYEIEVISPVHIGSGGAISPIEYVVEDNFYRADMDRIFEDERFDTNRFIEGAKGGALYLGRFASELAKEHVRYALDISHSTKTNLQGLIGSRSSTVREFIKTKDDAYIPGSSIKGAIRTAILWWALKNNRVLFENVERYLEILLNARNLSERIRNARNLEDIKREIERNQNLKQDSDAYMDLLVMVAGGEVRKIKQKMSNLSKIRKEHVDEEIEKLVFGEDPTKDLLKTLQVSDTKTISHEGLKVEEVRTLSIQKQVQGHDWEDFYTFVEALKPDTKMDFEISIDEFLLEGDAARELHFESKQELVREIRKMCNEFANDFIEDEIRFFERYNTPRELDEILEFYKSLRERIEENSFMLHLAWGSGWHGMTVGRLLQDHWFDFLSLRKKYQLGEIKKCKRCGTKIKGNYCPKCRRRLSPNEIRKIYPEEFPKTRRIVFEEGKPKYPLGWVKLRVGD